MKPDKSKRELVRELRDLAGDGLTPDRTDLWRRLITGEYPENPEERHPQINRWLSIAMDDDGVVNCGFDAPEWAEAEADDQGDQVDQEGGRS